LRGEQLLIERRACVARFWRYAQRRRVFLQWDGEMHGVSLFDPISAVEASHSHQGGLTRR
jgi:3-methylcrotonyl-CoA carboxylase alpha subunit